MFVIFALKDESNRGAMGKTGAGPFFRRPLSALQSTPWSANIKILQLWHCSSLYSALAHVLDGRLVTRSISREILGLD